MEREKCIKYLFNELLNEGIDMKTVAEMLTPMKQINENVCLKINKIITHKTNIVSKGKTIRIKMKYRSKGKYKIQGFGLIYKEHTV